MARTDTLPDWTGRDVYIIGGGPSLRQFFWWPLAERATIGCNQAFELGHSICKICAFGDYLFWKKYQARLAEFAGWVVTNYRVLSPPEWLCVLPRMDHGMARDQLAWNGHTGAMAVHLALMLGAVRVFLLGFDMARNASGQTHWHDHPPCASGQVQNEAVYKKFRDGLRQVIASAQEFYPDASVFRVSDEPSDLEWLPHVSFAEVKLERPLEALVH